MAIVVFCDSHTPKLRLTLSDDRAGSNLPCPKCGLPLTVPVGSVPAPVPAPAPVPPSGSLPAASAPDPSPLPEPEERAQKVVWATAAFGITILLPAVIVGACLDREVREAVGTLLVAVLTLLVLVVVAAGIVWFLGWGQDDSEPAVGGCRCCGKRKPLCGSTAYCRRCAGGWYVVRQNQKRHHKHHRPH
jgi:hypothetical protein